MHCFWLMWTDGRRYRRWIQNSPISPIHLAFISTRAASDLMTWYVWLIPPTASASISHAIKQSQTIKDDIPIISMEMRNWMPSSTESLSLEWQLKTLLVQCSVFKICLMFFKLHIWHIILGWQLPPCWYLRQISANITGSLWRLHLKVHLPHNGEVSSADRSLSGWESTAASYLITVATH